jgi:hypothetical protein
MSITVESSTGTNAELKDINSGKSAPPPPRPGLTLEATGSGLNESTQAELEHAVGDHGKDASFLPAYKAREDLKEVKKWSADDQRELEKLTTSGKGKGVQCRINELVSRAKSAEAELKRLRDKTVQNEVAERVNLQVDIPGERHADLLSEPGQPPAQSTTPQNSGGVAGVLPEHQARVNRVANRIADWDETIRGVENVSVPVAVTDVLQRLENSAEVIYAIAKDPHYVRDIQDPVLGVETVRTVSEDLFLEREHAVRLQKHIAAEPLTDEERTNAETPLMKDVRMKKGLTRAIYAEENSAELARYLVRNPAAYEALLNAKTEAGAIAAIHHLAAELAGSRERERRPRSRLNPPIRPVGGGGTSFIPSSLADAAEQSQSAYRKARGGRAGRFD